MIDANYINDIIINFKTDNNEDYQLELCKRATIFEQRFIPTFVGNRDIKYLVNSIVWQIDCSESDNCSCSYGGTSLLIAKVDNNCYSFIDLWQCCLTYDNVLIMDIANNFDALFTYALIDKHRLVYSYDLLTNGKYDISLYNYYSKDIQILINKVKLLKLNSNLTNIILTYFLTNIKIEKPKMLCNRYD